MKTLALVIGILFASSALSALAGPYTQGCRSVAKANKCKVRWDIHAKTCVCVGK